MLEKPDFYKICYTFLAVSDSKIYLVKTVANGRQNEQPQPAKMPLK